MYSGQAYSDEFYFSEDCLQVTDFTYLDDQGDGYINQQQIWIGERVDLEDDMEHWLNGVFYGRQSDGIKYKAGKYMKLMPGSQAKTVATPLAKHGTRVLQIAAAQATGGWAYQEVDSDVIPSHYKSVFSVYARKPLSGTATISLKVGVNLGEYTVSSANRSEVTCSDLDMQEDMGGLFMNVRTGRGKYQFIEISTGLGDTFTLSRDMGTPPEAGDKLDLVKLDEGTIQKIDELRGVLTTSASMTGYDDWMRYFVVYRPPDDVSFDRYYVWIEALSSSDSEYIWVDAAKLELTPVLTAGFVSAIGDFYLEDSNKSWGTNDYYGQSIIIMSGDAVGTEISCAGNDGTKLNGDVPGDLAVGDVYMVTTSDSNTLPTQFIDDTPAVVQARTVAAYNIRGGDLILGGGLEDEFARLVILNQAYEAIIRMGEGLDENGFRGLQLLKSTGIALQGGAIVARADQGFEDSGKRVRFDHEGLEAWDDDGILRAFFRADAIGLVLGESPLQQRVELNDLGITAIDPQGRVFFNVNPEAGSMIAGVYGGNYISFDGSDLTWVADNASLDSDGTITSGEMVLDALNNEFRLGGALMSWVGDVVALSGDGYNALKLYGDLYFPDGDSGLVMRENGSDITVLGTDRSVRGSYFAIHDGSTKWDIIDTDRNMEYIKSLTISNSSDKDGWMYLWGWLYVDGNVQFNGEVRINDCQADGTLSGTPKLFKIHDSNDDVFYVRGYPTVS